MSLGRRGIRKIALVEPTTSTTTLYSGIRVPRQGAVLLGTILAERGYEVEVQIEELQPIDWPGLMSADLVGISTITPSAPRCYRIADALRRAGVPVVLGGFHVTFLPDEGLEHADFVVRGEGEDTIVELVRALETGGDLSRIRGLSFNADGERVHNPDRELVSDLDRYPIPDFSLVRGMKRGGVVTVVTRRGCPFNCSFCCVAPFNGRKGRETSVERVLTEIEQQLSWVGTGGVLFIADDIFNLRPERMKRILRGMLERRLTPLWVAQVRHEAARDPKLLELMQQTNCFRVFVGFESINPRTLALYDKRETVADVVESVRAFHGAGIRVHGMFVLGSDEDTVETVYETGRFAETHDLDSMQMNILTPLPGSRFFKEMSSEPGRLFPAPWTFYDGQHVVHVPARISPPVLQESVTKAMIRFYSLKAAGRRLAGLDLAEAAIRLYSWRFLRRSAQEFITYADWLSRPFEGPPVAARPSWSEQRASRGAVSGWGRPGQVVKRVLGPLGLGLAHLAERLRPRWGLDLASFAHLPTAFRRSVQRTTSGRREKALLLSAQGKERRRRELARPLRAASAAGPLSRGRLLSRPGRSGGRRRGGLRRLPRLGPVGAVGRSSEQVAHTLV